ncbi:hypothetical protein SV7mr_31470 [Stieleria bergensis]|uniref:Uncharacterized protein n=1 Tax=Stieleria bergensis TaxID=2528025 RepID=A0A517SX56_9BACT|nr:hypothetical protein SV7mr_31470 [Planctomycetes bacterium SV_7m_r]
MASATNHQRIEAEYTAAHVRALTLLENLHQRIEDTPAPSDDGPAIGWDDVGSLRHLCARLEELMEGGEND